MSHNFVADAQRVIDTGEGNLFDVLPKMIRRLIEDEGWKGRTKDAKDNGEPFTTFREFAEYPLWHGLNCSWNRLMLYCEHDPECRSLLLEQVNPLAGHGEIGKGRVRVDNINSKVSGDTDPGYIFSRLKRDRPDLARQVIEGGISALAATIEAGIRKRMKSVLIYSPDAAIGALLRVFSTGEILMAGRKADESSKRGGGF